MSSARDAQVIHLPAESTESPELSPRLRRILFEGLVQFPIEKAQLVLVLYRHRAERNR